MKCDTFPCDITAIVELIKSEVIAETEKIEDFIVEKFSASSEQTPWQEMT